MKGGFSLLLVPYFFTQTLFSLHRLLVTSFITAAQRLLSAVCGKLPAPFFANPEAFFSFLFVL
jgi:hypothetical protein